MTGFEKRCSISIIICSYNRANVLVETLESYATLNKTDSVDVELLIVDNNSSDHTREIAKHFISQHAQVRYVFEEIPGLSQARNTGIKESKGDIVAFVDDDIYFDVDWLTNLHQSFVNNPEVVSVGGCVVAHFDGLVPEWLSEDNYWIYGVTRYGDIERPLTFPEVPIGCNMAFRKSIFNQAGVFDLTLGRKGTNLLSGEENAIFSKISDLGKVVSYSPDMTVQHRIPAERLTKKWIYSRFYWHGISEISMQQISKNSLNRVGLVKTILKAFFSILKILFGEKFDIKEMYWHLMKYTEIRTLQLYFNYGVIRQCFIELL